MDNKYKMNLLCKNWDVTGTAMYVRDCSGDVLDVTCSAGSLEVLHMMETLIRMEMTLDEVTVNICTSDRCLGMFWVKGTRYGLAPQPNVTPFRCRYEYSVSPQ
jgi:hypothetical protein